MQSSIKVVVIDGHTLTRYGLMRLVSIDADITVVGECGLAAEAPALVESARPDVVVLDVALPDADGLQLARELRDRHAELGIVVLTAQAEDDVLFRALETGVSAFVDKTAPNAEVLCAIRHAAVAAASFTATGLMHALARRGQVAGCTVHSDRGSQFRSRKFVSVLARHDLVGSMGRVGAAGDNAAMESFFALLQKNVLDRRTWATRQPAMLLRGPCCRSAGAVRR